MSSWWAAWAVAVVACLLGGCTVTEHPGGGAAGGVGSVGGVDGVGGSGEGATTSNQYVDQIRQTRYEQLDLLLVVDNSAGMADKQALLSQAVPLLMQRFATPICVDLEGNPTSGNADASGACPDGSRAQFSPLHDIHVGVISSSLGSHGAAGTKDACIAPSDNDHGQLLGRVRGLAGTWNDEGFLAWDARGKSSPPGDANLDDFAGKLEAMVTSAGETGCRYPATLEAWYRFLIDPEPPAAIVVEAGSSTAVRQGVDDVLFQQRAAFLRPSSIVAIVMLSDKNDCSIQDEGYGWLVARASAMYRSTSQCLVNPSDHCCQSCGEQAANEGCPAIANDVECAKGPNLAAAEDDMNLRCYQQKRRFGFELLYPTTRYSDALRSPVVPQASTGQLVQNPLFSAADGKAPRDKGAVFLAGIVGVPWQDVADEASLAGEGLNYLTAAQLTSYGRWDVILGDPGANPPVLPTDPFLVETTADRTTLGIPQANPIAIDMLVPSTSNNPQANHINGHEHAPPGVGDTELQYACTFPLPAPRECEPAQTGVSCECGADASARNSPLCQPPAGGAAEPRQFYAKAYPGLRQLRVLKEFGENAIVASACPKVSDVGSPSYGYNPAVDALVGRVKEALRARCLPRPLEPDDDGNVPCQVIEASAGDGSSCNCAAPRTAVTSRVADSVRTKLREYHACGTSGGVPCSSFCFCALPQLSGEALQACQNAQQPPDEPGFCYINAQLDEVNVGAPELVADCSADSKRLIRFVGDEVPATGSAAFLVCSNASLGAAP